MDLGELLRSHLRQERPTIIFETPNGTLIHEGILPYTVSHAMLGLTPLGIGMICRQHPFAEWKIDPKIPIVVEAIG